MKYKLATVIAIATDSLIIIQLILIDTVLEKNELIDLIESAASLRLDQVHYLIELETVSSDFLASIE